LTQYIGINVSKRDFHTSIHTLSGQPDKQFYEIIPNVVRAIKSFSDKHTAAGSALQHNQSCKEFYQCFIAKGKSVKLPVLLSFINLYDRLLGSLKLISPLTFYHQQNNISLFF
jgi:hypothetical protein